LNNLSKKLKKIPNNENLDGFTLVCDINNYTININVEKLWKNSLTRAPRHPVDKFIREFCATMSHEHLHIAVSECYEDEDNKFCMGEECIIWALMEEKMPKWIYKFYKRDFYKGYGI